VNIAACVVFISQALGLAAREELRSRADREDGHLTTTDAGIRLTPLLETGNDEIAVALLREYFGLAAGGPGYRGRHFDSFDAAGTRASSADRFTSADLVAVSMLSVEIFGAAAEAILIDRANIFADLLHAIGPDRDLVDLPDISKSAYPAAWELHAALRSVRGLGATKVSKLMARKRPRLIPIYDSKISSYALGRTHGLYWEPLHAALTADNRSLHRTLVGLRDQAGVPTYISAIRVFDVLTWMEATSAADKIRQRLRAPSTGAPGSA